LHVGDRQIGFIYMPIASPEIESAVNLDSLRLKVYLEFLNGSITKSADVTPLTISDSRQSIIFFLGSDAPVASAVLHGMSTHRADILSNQESKVQVLYVHARLY